jgi:hypothetical protein
VKLAPILAALLVIGAGLAALSMAPVAEAAQPSWNMVSYYRFETQSCGPGALAQDDDGGYRGAHPMITQGGFTSPGNCTQTGKVGNAWQFGGTTTSFVHSAAEWGMSKGNSFSMMAWINVSNFTTAGERIFSEQNNGTEFFMRIDPTTNRLDAGIFTGGSCTLFTAIPTGALALNTWTHVGMTYDGAHLIAWINASAAATTTATGTICVSSGGPSIGGEYNPGIVEPFKGMIDEARVYSIPLNQSDMQTAMNDTTNANSSPAQIWHQADPGAFGSAGASCSIYDSPASYCQPGATTPLVAGRTYYWVSGMPGDNTIQHTPRFTLTAWSGTSPTVLAQVRWDDNTTCPQNVGTPGWIIGPPYDRVLYFTENSTGGNNLNVWGACQIVPTQNFTNVSVQFTLANNGAPGGSTFNTWAQTGISNLAATFYSGTTPVAFLYDANGTAQQPAPTITPTAVVDGTGACFTLSWSAVTGATGYNMYVDTISRPATVPMNSSGYTYFGTVAGTSFSNCGLIGGQAYFARIVAEQNGLEAAASAEGSNTTKTGAPGTPTITTSGPNLTVNWTAGQGANGYDVFVKNTSTPPAPTRAIPMNSTTWLFQGHVGGLSITVPNVDQHATYCFAIEGTNAISGEGDVGPSNCASVLTPRPFPPFLNGTYVPCGVFALNWSLPNGSITSYSLNRTGTLPVNRSASVPPYGNYTLREWNDTYPQINGTLSYTAQAVGPGGYSALSNVVNFTPPRVLTNGPCGLAFGGMSEAQLAQTAGLSDATSEAIPLMLAIVVVLIGIAVGFAAFRNGIGAAGGACAGILVSIGFGYLTMPEVMFAAIFVAAAFILSRRGRGGRR